MGEKRIQKKKRKRKLFSNMENGNSKKNKIKNTHTECNISFVSNSFKYGISIIPECTIRLEKYLSSSLSSSIDRTLLLLFF